MDTLIKVIGVSVVGIVAIIALGLLFSLPIMLLWNACLVPAIPGLAQIGWIQAWGINILSGLLFKSSAPSKD